MWTYRAYGITWTSEFEWPGVPTVQAAGPAVRVRLTEEARLRAEWSGPEGDRAWPLLVDERPLIVQKGSRGDFLLTHEGGGTFHVSSDATVVSCAVSDPAAPEWKRVLLDTVLWTTALLHGFEALHASAVDNGSGVIAFVGSMTGGKTSLALEFLRRGYRLFCDDVLTLERRDGEIVAHPSPPLMNVPARTSVGSELPVHELARIGDEIWSATPGSERPGRLVHLFLIERADGLPREVTSEPGTALDLRPHALVHGLVPGRERDRFELCADLAERVPLSHLRADLEAAPAELADLVASALGHAD